MSRAIPLLPLWAFGPCYRANFTFFFTCTELIALLMAVCCTEGAFVICCRHSLSKLHVIYIDERCVHSVLTPFMQVFGSVKEPMGVHLDLI
jgi:hypothetical protein